MPYQDLLNNAKKVVDLGCGNTPIPQATIGVDAYINPEQRSYGHGPVIDVEGLKRRGVTFVCSRIDVAMPFSDKEFDFAYSPNVFEHVDDPAKACSEMIRIAKSGLLILPGALSELLFGRHYHKWIIFERNNTLVFLKKRPFEDCPFGEHPAWDDNKKGWVATNETNPFDILLNEGNWYTGTENYPRLAEKIRSHFCKPPLMEIRFAWCGSFEYAVYS